MADDEKNSMFTQKAADKLRSPDDLDEYVRVTNPSVWVVLGACIAVMIGFFAWGFLGTAVASVSATGTCVQGEVLCFLPADQVAHVQAGDAANVGGVTLEVASISEIPVSRIEAREIVGGDFLANTLVQEDWTYVVSFRGEASFAEGVPISITITTERVTPASLIFKDAA